MPFSSIIILFILSITTMPPEALLCDKKAAADTTARENCNSPKVRWYKTKHNDVMCLVCFKEKVCTARAVLHENVRTPHN